MTDNSQKIVGIEAGCYDVFVTKTGDVKEPVIGWITNDDADRGELSARHAAFLA